MILPLDFGDLSILLAITAIILLITSEFLSSYQRKVLVNRRRLRKAGIVFAVFFLLTVVIRIVSIISPF
jgi:membrane-anchored protein YejM (alkaline phosphatase superfamily)